MKMPMNYEERVKLTDKFCGMNGESNLWTWLDIMDLKAKDLLEDYDLFVIYKDEKEWHSILYIQDKWYLVPEDREMVEIIPSVLMKYEFINKNFLGNPTQRFLKRKGQDEFDKLSDMDKQKVYTDTYMAKELDNIFEGLKSALSDVVDVLEKDKAGD